MLRKWFFILGIAILVFFAIIGWEFLGELRDSRVAIGRNTSDESPLIAPSQVSGQNGVRIIDEDDGNGQAKFALVAIDPANEDQLSQVLKEDSIVGVGLIGPYVDVQHVKMLADHFTLSTIVLYSTELLKNDIEVVEIANPSLKIHIVATAFPREIPSRIRVRMSRLQMQPSDPPD